MAWGVVIHLRRVGVHLRGGKWYLPPSYRQMSVAATPGYKAVIFDMYGVLIPSPMPKATEWEDSNGVPRGTIGRAIRSGGDGNTWRKFMRGEIGAEEFMEAFSQDCSHIAGKEVHVGSFLSALISGSMTKPLPVMVDAIQCARAEGLRTAVLSNNFLLPGGQSYLPLDRSLFDVIVESCREGMSKPDPRIYHLCADRLGVLPHEAVFLDDLDFNVQAAAQVGMHGITVREPAVAVKELEGVLQVPLSGFVPRTQFIRPDKQLPMDKLRQFLSQAIQLPSSDSVAVRQFTGSSSGSTYLLTCRGSHLVIKKKPQLKALKRELRALRALEKAGVPVPHVITECEDPSILGTPFLLMEYCMGRVFEDPSLQDLDSDGRRAVHDAMTQTLCHIHGLDLRAAGLDDYGETGEFLEQEVRRWTQHYRANETQPIPAMDRLIHWLPLHLPKQHGMALVHGDFRLANLVFDREKLEVKAVLGWGTSAIGDPFIDLASSCMARFLPPNSQTRADTGEVRNAVLGVPTAKETFERYCGTLGLPLCPHWQFYMALCFFRQAAILQAKPNGPHTGSGGFYTGDRSQMVEGMADLAWDFATKEGFRIFNDMPKATGYRGTSGN